MNLIVKSIANIGSGVVAEVRDTSVTISSTMNSIKSQLIKHMDGDKLKINKIKLFTNKDNEYIIELDIKEEDNQDIDLNCYEFDLYRSNDANGEYELIAENIHPLTHYSDSDNLNLEHSEFNYYYKVKLKNKITGEIEEV